jgi:DNA-binding NarL/FixJ family response regulator
MAVKLLIVDSHALARKVLRRHLDQEKDFIVVGEAKNGMDGVAKAEDLQPDVVIMDISMPIMDGLEATGLLRQRFPSLKVLILSTVESLESCVRALGSGARGYVLKKWSAEEVVPAIRTIMEGRRYLGTGVSSSLDNLPDN